MYSRSLQGSLGLASLVLCFHRSAGLLVCCSASPLVHKSAALHVTVSVNPGAPDDALSRSMTRPGRSVPRKPFECPYLRGSQPIFSTISRRAILSRFWRGNARPAPYATTVVWRNIREQPFGRLPAFPTHHGRVSCSAHARLARPLVFAFSVLSSGSLTLAVGHGAANTQRMGPTRALASPSKPFFERCRWRSLHRRGLLPRTSRHRAGQHRTWDGASCASRSRSFLEVFGAEVGEPVER